MLNFIVYEDKTKDRELYIKLIRRFLYSSDECYKIYEFDRYNPSVKEALSKIGGIKIYLISLDVPGPSPFLIARKVRELGDLSSPIILLTSKDKKEVVDELHNILFLDIINKENNLIKNLITRLNDAYRIVMSHAVYTFSSFDETYRVLYDDIYYIKKNYKDDSVTIYTKNDSLLDYITIKKIEEILKNDSRFLKVHRSCIVNINNIVHYDKKKNVITFNNGAHTDLVSRKYRTAFINRLNDFSSIKQ